MTRFVDRFGQLGALASGIVPWLGPGENFSEDDIASSKLSPAGAVTVRL
jgi:hypothetical protein